MAAKPPYHHGNLKPALLEAALQLISEVGPAAFTLREVARRAGISHNAPYRHFREKDELLAAIAAQGFERLGDALANPGPWKSGAGSGAGKPALERFQASGLAYVRFALNAPEHLLVMFDWPLTPAHYPNLAASAERAFSILVGLVQGAQTEGSLPPGDAMEQACIAWSMVHGVAKLAISHRLPFRNEAEALSFAARSIQALYDGMAPPKSGPKKRGGRG